MQKILVAGGSSPFTAGLIDAIKAAAGHLPACEIVLHGRNTDSLQKLEEYADFQLGGKQWKVHTSTNLAEAAKGSQFILHQIRYGGLELRRRGEELCVVWQTLADETLGPAALLSALVTYESIVQTSELLQDAAPNAVVLNLTNPLSFSTSLMHRGGLKVLGICELPTVTAQEIAQLLGVSYDQLSWQYSGLNHRGFVHNIHVGGKDVHSSLVSKLGESSLSGVSANDIRELSVVPTKYFPLFTKRHQPPPTVYRSDVLQQIRDEILVQLTDDPRSSPAALRKRYLEWYPQAVVPILRTLCGSPKAPIRHLVNLPESEQREGSLPLTREGLVTFSPQEPTNGDGFSGLNIQMDDTAPLSSHAQAWLDQLKAHEQRFLDGISPAPSIDWITHVLESDPTLHGNTSQIASELLNELPRWQQKHRQEEKA